MEVIIEIRPAEGGVDAKMLVGDMASLYLKYAANHRLAAEQVESAKVAEG